MDDSKATGNKYNLTKQPVHAHESMHQYQVQHVRGKQQSNTAKERKLELSYYTLNAKDKENKQAHASILKVINDGKK